MRAAKRPYRAGRTFVFWIVFGVLVVASVPLGWLILRRLADEQAAKAYPTASPIAAAASASDGGTSFRGGDDEPYEFTYPSSWSLQHGDAQPGQPYRDALVSASEGSSVRIALLRDAAPAATLLKQSLSRIASSGYRLGGLGDVRELGGFTGEGRQFVATGANGPLRLQVLVTTLDGDRRLVLTTWLADKDGRAGPRGINMIVNSLKLTTK